MPASVTVMTHDGPLRGSAANGVTAFRGIPYAAPPVGALRLLPPQPVAGWSETRDALLPSAAPVQPPGRGDLIMGPMDVPGQSEDCLYLNVWTPTTPSDSPRPVLVWFHGGGFTWGSGSAAWYDGSVLAARGDVVVVSVSYRLGPLGYLYLPPGTRTDEAQANLALQDQCQALQWVRDNIASFGGDPSRVTVSGQSAGALSIVGLAAMPKAKDLFQRAILVSAAIGVPAKPVADAEEVTDAFFQAVGLRPGDVTGLLDLPAEAFNEANGKIMMALVGRSDVDPRLRPASMIPLQLVADGNVLPANPSDAARDGSMSHLDILAVCMAEEIRFAYAFDEPFWSRDEESIRADVRRAWGAEGEEVYDRYARRDPTRPAPDVLCDLLSEDGAVPTFELLEILEDAGHPGYLAWFSWRGPGYGGRVGACHTLDLPFMFNNLAAWDKAPMLAGVDPATFTPVADAYQDSLLAFVRDGRPPAPWPTYTRGRRAAMEFGSEVRVIDDPASLRSARGLTFGSEGAMRS